MQERTFPISDVLKFLLCLVAPIASLWLAPDWTWLIAVASCVVTAKTKVMIFLSLGEFLICVSSFVSLMIWFVRLVAMHFAVK